RRADGGGTRLPRLRGGLVVRLLRAPGHARTGAGRNEPGGERGAAFAGSADGPRRRRSGGWFSETVRRLRAEGVREVEGDRAGVEGERRVSTAPLRILVSRRAAGELRETIAQALGAQPHQLCSPGDGVEPDIAFVTRDVTGLSTKHHVLPDTRVFYDAMANAHTLRWVHIHSA